MVSDQARNPEPEEVVPTDSTPEEMRPIAVHVEKIVYEPNLKHTQRERVAVIDLEFSKEQIADMVKTLQTRLESKSDRGSIRLRFKGTMVLE